MSTTEASRLPVTEARPSAVRLDNVSVFYGEVLGLSQMSLELEPGITGIVGPNGCGKTTLMRAVLGLVAPREGSVQVLGGDPFHDEAIRSRITFVPATENFYPNLSGLKNLEVAFLARGHSRLDARELAIQALATVGLTEHGRRYFGQWSRGMRQRLKLGVALTLDSEIVLLDEPFLGVDPPSRRALRDHILQLASGSRTIVVSSHVLHEIDSLTNRVGVLASGRLLGFGAVDRLLQDLKSDHPHRINVQTDDPRRLGTEILQLPHITELRVVADDELEFVSVDVESAYRELPQIVAAHGLVVRRLETLDHSLEAVFEKVTEAGAQRL